MRQPLVTNIQKYSIHDGTGIRTTVFFKGCPLACKWCHNPETQSYKKEILFYEDRCAGCGDCRTVCPVIQNEEAESMSEKVRNFQKSRRDSACIGCGKCVDECFRNARELCGTEWSVDQLVKEILKDQAFYETSGGGVTLSGGEVLAQDPEFLEKLMKTLHARGIRIFVDTCGAVPKSVFERVLPYVDTFLYDLKLMTEELHREYTGSSNHQILENLKWLSEQKASVWIRIPVIGGVNDSAEEIGRIGKFLKEEQIGYRQIHLLPYHNTGSSKYEHLEKAYEGQTFTVPETQAMEAFRGLLETYGLGPVYIGG